MTRRSFAGYACEESLSVGLFGEYFRAKNKNGVEARVLVVDSELSQRQEFATGLARFGAKLKELVHPHIVTTQTIGRGKDGSLVVIASSVESAMTLDSVLDRQMPKPVALSICMGVLRGLAYAHQEGVIHGGVHPQSVLIDGNGVSQLADFGLARALSSAAASPESGDLLSGLKGYLAPELTLGSAPEIESDVYSIGILVCQLLWQSASPPSGDSSGLVGVLKKAIEKKSDRRYSNAGELESALRAVIKTESLATASGRDVQAFLTAASGASGVDADLDADTADFLSSLDVGGASNTGEVTAIAETRGMGLSDALGGLFEDDDEATKVQGDTESAHELDDEGIATVVVPAAVVSSLAKSTARRSNLVDPNLEAVPEIVSDDESLANTAPIPDSTAALPAAESNTDLGDATTVDRTARPEKAAYSEGFDDVIDNDAPISIVATKSRSHTKPSVDDYSNDDATPLPAPRPFHADGTHVGALVEQVEREAASQSPFDDEDDLPEAQGGRFKSLRLVALIVFVLAALIAVAFTKTDLFRAAAKESKTDYENSAQANQEQQPKDGMISIVSDTDEAAVWVLIGRSPTQSFSLSSGMIHELRIDHEGYQSAFISVASQHWSGENSERKAQVSLQLVQARGEKKELPAFPPEMDPPLTPAGAGQGPIFVDAKPRGAEVWLWVGTTPLAELKHIEAGKDYEFKILKDGFRPAFVVVKSNDWFLSGSAGPIRRSLTRNVSLEATPSAAAPDKGSKKKTKRSKKKFP